MNNKPSFFARIAEAPKAKQLASAVRQGFRRYAVEDVLDDLADLALDLINGEGTTQALATHPLAAATLDKRLYVVDNRTHNTGVQSLVDNPRNAGCVTIDLGSRKPAARV